MQQKEPTENQSATLVDANTDKRIHEHLTNPTDVITEDDIKNVLTTIAAEQEEIDEPASADDAGDDNITL